MKSVFSGVAMALAFITTANAQTVTAPPAETASSENAAILRAGTSVPLRTLTELTTEGKKLKVGYRFNLEVSEPVTVNNKIVIPVGSPAMGEVVSVRNKGMWGKSGKIEVRILYVRANDLQIRLSGSMDDKGVTGTAGVVGAAVLLPVAGFFLTGTSARIPAGSNMTGFVEEDVPITFAPGAPVGMTVPTSDPAK
ncbi:hypothetical protein [Sphingomonas hengshuiensis]|uniref:Uncharacterized protein n=1 Tax=Sphingomonas hengshuiensis TaxID=1609977 RepID=A0A7U4JAU8_9SPHN|nr:hypothetical protein [Sphingomonas hengshuiensis]AJP73403.1 hypothetical protein TS85_18830 [Sphingomonas hengshuiensis]